MFFLEPENGAQVNLPSSMHHINGYFCITVAHMSRYMGVHKRFRLEQVLEQALYMTVAFCTGGLFVHIPITKICILYSHADGYTVRMSHSCVTRSSLVEWIVAKWCEIDCSYYQSRRRNHPQFLNSSRHNDFERRSKSQCQNSLHQKTLSCQI